MTQTLSQTARRSLHLAAGAFFLVALPASAQGVPSWAKPSAPEATSNPLAASIVPCPPGQTDPGNSACVGNAPQQMPLDGGLALLALAGGGYAVRRLRGAEA